MHPDFHPQIRFKHVHHFPECRVLIVAPHCDDETIGCGGTIIKSARAGCDIEILFVAVAKALDHPSHQVRMAEAVAACSHLGVKNIRFLNHCIRNIDSKLLAHDVAERVAVFKPRLIVLPWFGDNHVDHWIVNDALSDAWTMAGRPVLSVLAYEIWTPSPVDTLVDISAEMPTKMRALREYQSQLKLWRYEPMVASLNSFRAHSKVPPYFRRVRFAEGFLRREITEYIDMVTTRRKELQIHDSGLT
jgi:N-acetylglucosamine malate deacetylase 1